MLTTEPEIGKMVKSFVLMEDVNRSENVISWQEMLEEGDKIDDKVLVEKEQEQAVNQACMLIYTSGTTGPPKGNTQYSEGTLDLILKTFNVNFAGQKSIHQ